MEQTFTLTVTGTENAEWQGHIKREDGSAEDFQSVLELMKLIQHGLEREAR